jgi:hypothetical protein
VSNEGTGVLLRQYYDKAFTFSQPAHAHPSFRTERADFFLPLRSCEAVGLRREKSLFLFRQPASFGDVGLMLWLVIKGAKPPALDATASSSAAA